ncbi:MAG: molecular chaperone HtpG [Wenzhouxiangellaceae bacterium]|nr:molecular chaperone HtpG [Wenzhouxiangellaceae bacterium]
MNSSTADIPGSAEEIHRFDTEVEQLLGLMINALYSNREIFLRELISNASDALDKLRFEALTDEQLKGLDADPRIAIKVDAENHRLEIEDNGIGMSREEVIDNLGTIARSGTARFLEQLSGDRKADAKLIGQFGVGFYSAFIVAERVTVETRRAGLPADQGVRWRSDGKGEYTLEAIERPAQGTRIMLELSEDHHDLADPGRVRGIVQHYSNHVSFPIRMRGDTDDDGDAQALNDTQALWTRPKTEISDEEYREFYQGISGDFRDPATWAHHRVEGAQSYSMLLYVPGQAPFDLAWNRDDRRGLKLYIQRVFIMDAAEQLVPRYLRFIRGVVDSADLPLNISREILQDNPLLARIRAAVIKRSLDMIEKLATDGGEAWQTFQREFGNILKEGVIDSGEHRERVAGLLRFASSTQSEEHAVSFADYLERAGEKPEAIWYLTAESLAQAKASPHLEAFDEAGVEVLLLTDPIDAWLVGHLSEFKDVPLKSAASGEFGGDNASDDADDATRALCGRIKKLLGERVGNVTPSKRLRASASCITGEEGGMNLQMRRMLRQAGQPVPETKPDLEINPSHALVTRLADTEDEVLAAELAHLLLDQALLIEGGELADPAGFVARVNRLLAGDSTSGPASDDQTSLESS